jgi:hypothetical protein
MEPHLKRNEEDWSALRAWAERYPSEAPETDEPIPFDSLLAIEDRHRLRADLLTVLAEPELSGEPIDTREIAEILREYAEIAGWDGPLWPSTASPEPSYFLDLPSGYLKALRFASPAVQRVVEELISGPLARNPFGLAGEISQRVKKMPDRDLWQIYLPDGFRLRYRVDEPARTVHVVYIGPHSDSHSDGREDAVRQAVHRRKLERRKDGEEPGG